MPRRTCRMFAIYHLKSLKVLNFKKVTSEVCHQWHLPKLPAGILVTLVCCANTLVFLPETVQSL